ncbi:MAG: hypothetical protein LBL79_07970 [Prevotella sp.]|nr:hypothetical protein [Prevotella sp.]
MEHDRLYTKIISAKAWLTRAKNKVKKYEEERNKTLFQDFENDPIWLDAMQKVKAKENKLTHLQDVLKIETENTMQKKLSDIKEKHLRENILDSLAIIDYETGNKTKRRNNYRK